jgi:PAS domain S-box-containing protein
VAKNTNELQKILDHLRANPRGMSVKQIAEAVGMNRISIARYLDILRTSGQVEMEHYGQAKVYYLSQRVPISSMLNFSSEYVVVLGKDQKIVQANSNFLNLIDLSQEEILHKQIQDVLWPITPDSNIETKMEEALEGEEVIEEICILKDDEDRYFQMKIIPTVFTDGSPGITIILDDITEQKRSLEILIENEEKYRMLFNNANDAIFLNELAENKEIGNFIEVNDIACERLGYDRKELLGAAFEEIIPPIDDTRTIMDQLCSQGKVMYEGEILHKEGKTIPVETSAHIFKMDYRWVVLSIARDITERKKLQEMEREAFAQIEKNLEQLATLSNKIRNPLAVIVGYEDMLPGEASEKILEQAEKINQIIIQLDCGWLETKEVRDFLKRRFGIAGDE